MSKVMMKKKANETVDGDAEKREPLDRLLIERSDDTRKKGTGATKTFTAREVPIHPTLRRVLDTWRMEGWHRRYGRAARQDDLIVPELERWADSRIAPPR